MPPELTSSFGLDPAIGARLREIGPVFNAEIVAESRALFAGTYDMSLPAGGSRHTDIAYGGHGRQVLDICRPAGDGNPVALFVPGGGFVGGDKSFYAHIPAFLARQGFVGVGMNYRLAPDFMWPSGAQDVSAAIDWLRGNVRDFGGDPDRIVVIAQSAGAVHAATALLDRRFHPAAIGSVRAAVLMSGLYKIEPGMIAPNVRVYFGDDEANYRDRSATAHVPESAVPVVVTVAELEPDFFARQAAALIDAVASRDGHAPQFALLKGHNHLSPVLGMGRPSDLLGMALVRELARYCT